MTIPLAHLGHWYHVVLYLAPIILIGAGLWWSSRREARRELDENEEQDLP
ncbi:MAG: hypothetical protein WCK97_04345 [Actinomycetes bacterium]